MIRPDPERPDGRAALPIANGSVTNEHPVKVPGTPAERVLSRLTRH